MVVKDPIRLKRYRDKINYIIEMLDKLPFSSNEVLIKRGIFYSIQTAIESLVDIIAMIVKDLGFDVKDDYSNIELVSDKLKVPKGLTDKTKKANGLRNILVHRYNGVDDNIIISSIKEVNDLLFSWLNIIEEFLKK